MAKKKKIDHLASELIYRRIGSTFYSFSPKVHKFPSFEGLKFTLLFLIEITNVWNVLSKYKICTDTGVQLVSLKMLFSTSCTTGF